MQLSPFFLDSQGSPGLLKSFLFPFPCIFSAKPVGTDWQKLGTLTMTLASPGMGGQKAKTTTYTSARGPTV